MESTIQTKIPTVPIDIASYLGIPIDNLRVNATRWDLKPDDYSKEKPLKEEIALKLIEKFAETSRKEDVKEKASALLVDTGLVTNNSLREEKANSVNRLNGKIAKTKAKAKATVKRNKRKGESFPIWLKVIVFAIVIVAMVVQMSHTATVCSIGDKIEIVDWAFAFAIQFTGLLITIVKGKKSYLYTFAIAESLVNLLFYQPWAFDGVGVEFWVYWCRSVLLSGLLSFTIFSYSEVLSASAKINEDA